MQRAVEAIADGKCLIYPTETLYAIGGGAFHADAAQAVVDIKARPQTKPLPIIIGSMEQLGMITGWFSKAFVRLADVFWPGPLSVLVPTGRRLPRLLRDESGFTSVRLSAHPLARELCLRSGMPLIATSANISGQSAPATPDQIDPRLAQKVAAVVADKPWPAGGLPSTVVKCLGTREVAVIREGAVSIAMLRDAGFVVAPLPDDG